MVLKSEEGKKPLRNAVFSLVVLCALLAGSWFVFPAAGLVGILGAVLWVVFLNIQWASHEKQRERIWEGRAEETSNTLPWLSGAATLWLCSLLLLLPVSLVFYNKAFGTTGFSVKGISSPLQWIVLGVEQWILGIFGLNTLLPSFSKVQPQHFLSRGILWFVRITLLFLVLHSVWRRWSLSRQLRHSLQAMARHREYGLSRLRRMGSLAAPLLYRELQSNSDEDVRIGCIEVLAQLRDPAAPTLFRQILQNARLHTPALISAVSRALASISGHDEVLAVWKRREEELLTSSRPPFPREQLKEALSVRDDYEFRGYNPEGNPVVRRSRDQSNMVFIQGGLTRLQLNPEVMEESAESGLKGPERVVYTEDYLLDKCPITVEQYLQFLREVDPGGHAGMEGKRWVNAPCRWAVRFDQKQGWVISDKQFARHPMVHVSWEGANAYANWVGGTLPTLAQFKRAAFGKHPEQRHFPWGNQPLSPQRAVYRYEGSSASTTPVGELHQGRSPFGVYELSGNVSEWCLDAYDPWFLYLVATDNPELHDDNADLRVLLGGSWNEGSAELNNYAVSFASPMTWSLRYGFRCVVPLSTLR